MLWQKWSIISLLLFILSCGDDEMTKPTLRGIWARGGTKADVTSMADTGFQKTALEYAKLNGILYQQGEWADFVDRAFGKTYYVQCTSGNDTTGDGTTDYPFKTIPKAIDMIEKGGFGTIVLNETGIYDIDHDVDAKYKKIKMYQNSGITAVLRGVSYVASSKNKLYQIQLENSYFYFGVDSVLIPAPSNTGVNWDTDSNAIFFAGVGNNTIISNIDTAFEITNTAATGGYPALIHQTATCFLDLFLTGDYVTNDKGCILDQTIYFRPSATITGYNYVIDNASYEYITGELGQNQIITTGELSASIGDSITLYINGSSLDAHDSSTFNDTDSDVAIEAIIQGMFNAMFESMTPTISFSSTRTVSDEVKSMTIEIEGGLAQQRIPFGIYFSGTDRKGYFYELQEPKKHGSNITRIIY